MKNLNKEIATTDFMDNLFEVSIISFCSNVILFSIIHKKSPLLSKKAIGMKLKSMGCTEKVIKSEGKTIRGWMVKYIG